MCVSKRFVKASCLTVSAAVLAFTGMPVAYAQGNGEQTLEEIIVTAQKREQALADIPMSITVLTGDALERQQADNFQDLVAMIPGFSLTTSQRGATRITLRGINTGGVASTVGVYVDDVPFGSSTGLANGAILSGDFDTFDLARVEVLRGPQGTLYGASSLGGVLKYVPNAPSTEGFEAAVRVGAESVKGADTGFAFTGVVNMPLSDTLAVRLSGFNRSDEGFIDSIGNNPVYGFLEPDFVVIEGTKVASGLNSLDTTGGRLSLLFAPSDDFSVNITAMTQEIESGAPDTVDGDPATLSELYGGNVQSRYQDAFSEFEYRVLSADVEWDLGGMTLESITSDSSFEQEFQQDAAIASGFVGGLTSLSAYLHYALGIPLSAVVPQVTSTDKVTQEFRLVSDESDDFEWMVGAYYTEEDSLISQEIVLVTPGTETPAGLPGTFADLTSNYEELAFFANGTWHISSEFELSVGARTSSNDQTATQVTSGLLTSPSDWTIDSDESPFTWSVSPRYQVSENTSVYGRIATGFRPGGPNVVPPDAPSDTPRTYDSDSLTSYEVGLKTTSEDGKFSLDVAAYLLDWEDVQLYIVSNGYGVNANGSTAKSKGLEFAAGYYPRDGLRLGFNGAYTDAYLTADTDPTLVGGVNGDPLPFVPEWSFGADADYEWSLDSDKTAYVGGNLSYIGDRPAGFDNRDSNGGIRDADAYTTLGLRAGIATDKWSVEVYGKNVTDEMGITSIGAGDEGVTGRVNLGVIRPRTFGVNVGVRF